MGGISFAFILANDLDVVELGFNRSIHGNSTCQGVPPAREQLENDVRKGGVFLRV